MLKYSRWLEQIESRDHLLWASWLAVAIIVGVGRFIEEALTVYLPRGDPLTFSAALNFVAFYAQIVWAYTAATAILIRQPWRRTLGPAMLGTLLGVLPPLMDLVFYGAGNFNYFYQFDYPHAVFGPIPIGLVRGIPLGEALAAYASAGLLAAYVALRSRSLGRTVLAFLVGYELIHIWGSGLPTLAARLESVVQLSLLTTLSLVQVILVIAIYYGLNPALLRQAVRRLPHALPGTLLVLLGGAIANQPIGPTAAIALIAGIVTMFTMHQNDFYDQTEDAKAGRIVTVTQEDMHFFHAMLILILIVIATYQISIVALLLVFYLSTLLYHHRRFRLKRIFPLSYLIEGVCAAAMVSVGALSTVNKPEYWTVGLGAAAGFLGFALGSPFKDYKDIDGDQAAGNQTLYTLALARKWNLQTMHVAITLVLMVLTAIPVFWLYQRGVSGGICILLGTLACLSIPATLLVIQDRTTATKATLWSVNVYLLICTLAAWQFN